MLKYGKKYRIDKLSNFGIDKKKFFPGKSIKIFHYNKFTFAILVCYDIYFSEYVSRLKRCNLDFLIVQASVPPSRGEFWRSLIKIRSSELQVPIVSTSIGSVTDEPVSFVAYPDFTLIPVNNSSDLSFMEIEKIKRMSRSPLLRGRVLLNEGLYGPYLNDVQKSVSLQKINIFKGV